MDMLTTSSVSRYGNALTGSLSMDALRQVAPAVFSASAHTRTSSRYTFIPTERVLTGLMRAGFEPVAARQVRSRLANTLYSRHLIRLRRRFETVQLKDAIPEVVLLNSHDGTSAYHLRLGLFRVVCTNGLIVSMGCFPTIRVPHRNDVVDAVIAGAVELTERFEQLADRVRLMEQRMLFMDEQIQFAEQALSLRYTDVNQSGMQPSQLLHCRRLEDSRESLWNLLNRVQENLLRGGLTRHAASGRLTRTRRITSISEDVRLNSGLWDLAAGLLEREAVC
jgi:hypothetical protein